MGYTTGHKWTTEEENYLISNYARLSQIELEEKLSLPFSIIKDRACKLRKKGSPIGERENNIGEHGNKTRWKDHIKKDKLSQITERNSKVTCCECGKEFLQVTQTHLNSHHLDITEYRNKYGDSELRDKSNSKAWGRKAGLLSVEKHKLIPELWKEYLSKAGKKGIRVAWEAHPDKLKEGARKAMYITREKLKQAGRLKAVAQKGGQNAIQVIRETKGIPFEEYKFDSQEELLWYKHHKKLGRKIEVHKKVGEKEFDFYLQETNTFHEHHPILQFMKTYKIKEMYEYGKERRNCLDKNGYKNATLVITEKIPN